MSNDIPASYFPICDLHHSPMRRVMLDEQQSTDSQSFHQCERHACSRIFREQDGYSDFSSGRFDDSRASRRACPACGASMYLSEVDHARKIESWECPEAGCDYAEDASPPSSR